MDARMFLKVGAGLIVAAVIVYVVGGTLVQPSQLDARRVMIEANPSDFIRAADSFNRWVVFKGRFVDAISVLLLIAGGMMIARGWRLLDQAPDGRPPECG